MATKSNWLAGNLRFFSSATGSETIRAMSPVYWEDDFLGYKLNKYIANENTVAPWHTITAGTPTSAPLLVANTANGIVQMALAATDEAERSVLYMGDQLAFSLNQGLVFECRAAYHVVATTGTEKAIGLIGLASADNATADSVAVNAWFRCEGDANIYWETDDATTDDDDNDTGVDAVADAYHIFRIDATTTSAVKFYIDDALVGTADMSAVAAPLVQPYIGVEKAKAVANTGLATIYVDYVKIWQNRS